MKSILTRLILCILAVFAPIQTILASVLFLVSCDLVTGIWAAKKRGESITSSGLRRTVTKLIVYEVVICFGFISEKYLTGPLLPMCSLVSSYVGLVELLSLIENINCIAGGDVLKALIDRIKKAE